MRAHPILPVTVLFAVLVGLSLSCGLETGGSDEPCLLLFAPDGKSLAAPIRSGTVRIWDVSTGNSTDAIREADPLRGSNGWHWPGGLAFSPDGQTLATVGWGPKVWLWDIPKQQLQSSLSDNANAVQTEWPHVVAFAPDGQTLASANYDTTKDSTMRIWDLKSRDVVRTIQATAVVNRLYFSPDGKTLAALGHPKQTMEARIEFWDIASEQIKSTLSSPKWSDPAVSPDLTMVAVETHDATIELWDVAAGQRRHILPGWSQRPDSIVFSPDGKTLAVLQWAYDLVLCDVETGEWRAVIDTQTGVTRTVAFAPDGKVFATAGSDNSINVWDSGTLKKIRVLQKPNRKPGATEQAVTSRPRGLSEVDAPEKVQQRLQEVRDIAKNIPLGMRRSEVEKHFSNIDGGLGSYPITRYYVHPQVKVEVMYDRTGGHRSTENKVIGTPRVYRENPLGD